MLLSIMECKVVINVIDGSNIGHIIDLEIEPNSGQIFCIYIEPVIGFLNIFSKKDRIRIPWDQIVKIGEDVIIVNCPIKTVE